MLKYKILLILIVAILEEIIALSLLFDVLPNPLNCYHIIHDADNVSTVIFEEIQNKYITILSSNSKNYLLHKNISCDFYLIIFGNKEKAINALNHDGIAYKLNKNSIVDKNVLFIHNEMNFNKELQNQIIDQNLINDLIINVVLMELTLKENIQQKMEIVQIAILAPFSNKTKLFKRKDILRKTNTKNVNVGLELLLKSQVWDPIKLNATLEVAYFDSSILIYSKKGKPRGVEYRLIEEITSGWRKEAKAINNYITQVLFHKYF